MITLFAFAFNVQDSNVNNENVNNSSSIIKKEKNYLVMIVMMLSTN